MSSVGIVETKTVELDLPPGGFSLHKGGTLESIAVAYETYGELSRDKDNVVYICHALTGDAHVAGRYSENDDKPGWWDEMVGPGKGIDTDYYHVVCANILGGCKGTTGPSSTSPATGKPYGSSFPDITVRDIVRVQKLLLEQLGVERLSAVIGGSFGGMQVLEWGLRYPDAVDRCICVATGLTLSSQALAFDVVARDAILSDQKWDGGDYYEKGKGPEWGLSHARKIAHITYLSPEIMEEKFGREKTDEETYRFQVESYLDYQGKKLVGRFDANSYMKITDAMDSFDLVDEFGSYEEAFKHIRSRFLVIGLSSDWLFPPEQSVDLANALRDAGVRVSCCILEAPHGHDSFLIKVDHLSDLVRAFLPWVSPDESQVDAGVNDVCAEHKLISGMIEPDSRVLDLGCGDGQLLSYLKKERHVKGVGIEIEISNLVQVIDRGHDAFQVDLDKGLSHIPDNTYDCAVLGSTLQVVKKPRVVLKEMLRVAKAGIVTFPNFANWRNRVSLGISGKMPKSSVIPYEWYETPNIHLTTRRDFVELCRSDGIRILDMVCIPDGSPLGKFLVSMRFCALGAELILARITRGATSDDPACRM